MSQTGHDLLGALLSTSLRGWIKSIRVGLLSRKAALHAPLLVLGRSEFNEDIPCIGMVSNANAQVECHRGVMSRLL